MMYVPWQIIHINKGDEAVFSQTSRANCKKKKKKKIFNPVWKRISKVFQIVHEIKSAQQPQNNYTHISQAAVFSCAPTLNENFLALLLYYCS